VGKGERNRLVLRLKVGKSRPCLTAVKLRSAEIPFQRGIRLRPTLLKRKKGKKGGSEETVTIKRKY